MPSPGNLSNSGIELGSPALQVDSLPAELPGTPKKLMTQFKCDSDVFPVLLPNKHTMLPLNPTHVILHCPYT